MSCHLPPLTFMFFSSFTSLSKMQNEDSLQLFWCRGKITQRWNFSEWKCSFSLSLFFLFVLRCFTLEQLSRAIYLPLLLPFLLDTYGYICAKGLKKSGLACCKRTGSNFMWQTKMQKAAADILEEGEVMVSHYLSILPQTVTMSNGSDCRGEKGGTQVEVAWKR